VPFFRLRLSFSDERLIFGLVDALRADLSAKQGGPPLLERDESGRKTPVRTAIGGKRAKIEPLRGSVALWPYRSTASWPRRRNSELL